MDYFVRQDSIVRKIWGRSDIILCIFAGASAEFALNKSVDWLYFTGKLPANPVGRLFSTVRYARQIVFAPTSQALAAIDAMQQIHASVEKARGIRIPDWAYRDVLYMLIDYSLITFELLERKLSEPEKEEVFDVFLRVACRMQLSGLPSSYQSWRAERQAHLMQNLHPSTLTADLFRQYRKSIGPLRFQLLIELQQLIVPSHVRTLLGFGPALFLTPCIPLYKWCRRKKWDGLIRNLLLPEVYKKEVAALDMV